jgi:predicted outer membrane repeat protein
MDSRQRKTGGVLWLNGPRCSEELLSTLHHGNPNLYHASATSEAIVKNAFVVLSFVLCIVASPVFAATINVPADQSTIQAGIDAAANGDAVLVAPGTYFENINFMGKAVAVKSSGGPKKTIIDGSNVGSVVTFSSGENNEAVLSGFTVQHGSGGGIYVYFSGPVIRSNIIVNNTSAFGGGIYVGGTVVPAAQIIGNMIEKNNGLEFGGGIGLDAAGAVLIENNKISHNTSATEGGAIWIVNEADEVIVQNLMVGDTAPSGTEFYSLVPQSTTGYRLVNNTIVSTNPSADAAVVADGFNTNAQIFNNLIISPGTESALDCNPIYMDGPPVVQFNNAFSLRGTSYSGSCTGFSGSNGNISSNPDFVSQATGNYQLQAGSPAIDAGDNSAPDLPQKDLADKPRILDGNGDGNAVIDMGAYEFQPQ